MRTDPQGVNEEAERTEPSAAGDPTGRYQPHHPVSSQCTSAFDRFLNRGTAVIERNANQLNRERLAAQADSFGEALRLGLIGADDFA